MADKLTIKQRVELLKTAFTGYKSNLYQQLTNKEVAVSGSDTFSQLISKVADIQQGGGGVEYKLVVGLPITSSSGQSTGNKGAKVKFTKDFTIPYSNLGVSTPNDVRLLFTIAGQTFTGGSSGITSTSTELNEFLPIFTIERNLTNSSNKILDSFENLCNNIPLSSSPSINWYHSSSGQSTTNWMGDINFAPITGSYSAGTYTAALPFTDNSNVGKFSYAYVNTSTFRVVFMTGNTTYDYEGSTAMLMNPVYAVKITK
jgi:hypothetical protein